MKIGKQWRAAFLGGLALLAGSCGQGEGSAEGSPDAKGVRPPSVLAANVLPGTDLMVAEVGERRAEEGYLSSSGESRVRDIWLVDRAGGAVRPLMPGNRFEIERRWFLGPDPEVLVGTESDEYGVTTAQAAKRAEAPPDAPTYYLLQTAGPEGTSDLHAGTVADAVTRPLVRGMGRIVFMELRADDRLLVVAVKGGAAERFVFDLAAMRLVSRGPLAPGTATPPVVAGSSVIR